MAKSFFEEMGGRYEKQGDYQKNFWELCTPWEITYKYTL